jgi:hypothetical protein
MYRPEKGNDFKMLDRVINEQFQVGGTDIFVHKYLGPVDPEQGTATPAVPTNSNPIPELGIQDLIFMENRDRHYDPDVYQIRGIYTMQDLDFNLMQFGLFMHGDSVMIAFHLRNCVETLGRKLMAGDVLELPHLKDEYAINDTMVAMKRFYVVSDVMRPASGYSQTWYPHLIRAKCDPMTNTQQFKEILEQQVPTADGGTTTLADIMSTYNTTIQVNDAIIAQAELDAPMSGYDTTNLFVLPLDADGKVMIQDASREDVDASLENPVTDASSILDTPPKDLYVGYLNGDGVPPNGAPYGFGIEFPTRGVVDGQFFLRTDFFPNRLFRYDGKRWVKYEDNVRMTMTNAYDSTETNRDTTQPQNNQRTRKTLVTGFINNNNTATIAGKVVPERQALSKILKPKADN